MRLVSSFPQCPLQSFAQWFSTRGASTSLVPCHRQWPQRNWQPLPSLCLFVVKHFYFVILEIIIYLLSGAELFSCLFDNYCWFIFINKKKLYLYHSCLLRPFLVERYHKFKTDTVFCINTLKICFTQMEKNTAGVNYPVVQYVTSPLER